MIDFSNLVIRWTFGETKERPTSLQAFDMLECSLLFALKLFPNAEMHIVYNSLSNSNSLEKLKRITLNKATLLEGKNEWGNEMKNSFWKYIPLRINSQKYELVLDSDIVFWKVPKAIIKWLKSDGLLLNSDWNGRNYGNYDQSIPKEYELNAGIIGYPPQFSVTLPEVDLLSERFIAEQGFIVNEFTNSNRELFILPKSDVFQSNTIEFINKKKENIITEYCVGHFCGCNYCHYPHWDKYYKNDVWNHYHKNIEKIKNFRDVSKYNPKLKKGIIYRSSALCLYKNESSLESHLQSKNIETIVDLRADRELKEIFYNKKQQDKYKIIHAPFDPWKQSVEFQNIHNTGTNTEIAYHFFSNECKASIKLVIEAVINSIGAINIHCHAGKDRTGIIITLFHLLSGANKETILLDYLASKMDTKENYIQILLDAVYEKGGIIEYFKSCEISNEQIEFLKSKIVC
ncbi:tyrosine-protein phosphatase [Lutibacter citreus]|uniref:tyrosine-protein phosphatase n=1 Tax=Lutibacter citreus TaxID=2138210 RepID=UPI000DBE20FE|nr:tyrosine-protein phosphatase [Lutibacter citreus]